MQGEKKVKKAKIGKDTYTIELSREDIRQLNHFQKRCEELSLMVTRIVKKATEKARTDALIEDLRKYYPGGPKDTRRNPRKNKVSVKSDKKLSSL